MAEALHSLGLKGKELLMERGWKREISIERRPPKNLEHFLGINDIRVAVERSAENDGMELGFFFASWELQQEGWTFPVIPDAACHVEHTGKPTTILFEYDRGEESTGYLVRTKFNPYARGLNGFPFSGVLVVVDSEDRLEELREHVEQTAKPELFSFTLLEEMKRSWSLTNWFS